MSRLALAAAAALVLAGTATAATPLRWQPAHMAAALTALKYGHDGVIGGTCTGLGTRRPVGYARFRCAMSWQTNGPPLASGKVTVWARPMLKGRVCASTRNLAACRAVAVGPLSGDPRVCSYSTNKEQCAEDAAQNAVRKQVHDGDIRCALTSSLTADPVTFRCTFNNDPASGAWLVTFTRGASAWTVSVKPA